MWLFDNIFLDKDTPTALLDNPEIKSPDWKKPEEKAQEYDPKNDPIAPAVTEVTSEEKPEEKAWTENVSFDIGGDLDFSNIGTEEKSEDSWISTPEMNGVSDWSLENAWTGDASFTVSLDDSTSIESPSWTDAIWSIAMIQGGTASIVDSIDIGKTTEWTSWEVHLEIHNIEDHYEEGESAISTPSTPENNSIFGLMDAETERKEWEIAHANSDQNRWGEEISSFEESSLIQEEKGMEDEKEEMTPLISELPVTQEISLAPEVSESSFSFETIATWTEHSWEGRIQELIWKLILELKKLDDEEKQAKKIRDEKLKNIIEREEALEKEYATRKNALKYEREALSLPPDRHEEKARIKSLIDSFEEDLDGAIV